MLVALPWYYAPGYMSGALLAWCLFRGHYRYALTAGLLFQVWLLCFAICQITGGPIDWPYLIAIDMSAAAALVWMGELGEALVGLTFVVEVVIHCAYGWTSYNGTATPYADYAYWWATFYIACTQCVIVAGACINGGGKSVSANSVNMWGSDSRFPDSASTARSRHGMDKSEAK